MLPRNNGFGIVHAEVAGDGVVVQIVLDRCRDFAKQAFVNELLGQFFQAFNGVDVHVEAVGIIRAKSEFITAFADHQNDFLLLKVIPTVAGFKERAEIALVYTKGIEQDGVNSFAIDELQFVFLDETTE